jgi:hypothetical protein
MFGLTVRALSIRLLAGFFFKKMAGGITTHRVLLLKKMNNSQAVS